MQVLPVHWEKEWRKVNLKWDISEVDDIGYIVDEDSLMVQENLKFSKEK